MTSRCSNKRAGKSGLYVTAVSLSTGLLYPFVLRRPSLFHNITNKA